MKLWDGSLVGQLRKLRPSVAMYVIHLIGVFGITAFLYPASRFLPALLFAAAFIVIEFMAYHVLRACYYRRLRRQYRR